MGSGGAFAKQMLLCWIFDIVFLLQLVASSHHPYIYLVLGFWFGRIWFLAGVQRLGVRRSWNKIRSSLI